MLQRFRCLMSSSRSNFRHGLSKSLVDIWEETDFSFVDKSKRQVFEKRKLAIRLYADGESLQSIKNQTGILKQQLFYLAKRCTAVTDDGVMLGFGGLVPGRQVILTRANNLSNQESFTPKPGALSALFSRYPSVHESMKIAVLEGKRHRSKTVELNLSLWELHKYFLDLCDEVGIRGPHYPFCANTESNGKPAIYRWIKKLRIDNARKEFIKDRDSLNDNEENLNHERLSNGRSPLTCFQRVECDGHKIDIPIVLEIPSPTGEGSMFEYINRIWIVALVEAMSDAVIGYSLALGINYSGVDVIRAVENSLIPWSPRKLVVNGINYRDGDGIPNGINPDLSYVCFNELWLDNSMAQRSEYVLGAIERLVQAVPVFSPVASPNSHPWVEGFFNILEEAGIHRLPTTTGSSPSDKRRQKTKQLSHHLTYDELADIIDVLVCRINGQKSPVKSQTRNEVLSNFARRRGVLIRRIPIESRDAIFKYDIYEKHVIGRDHCGAVIRFKGARYTDSSLRLAKTLIGNKVLILAHSKKLRTIDAILEDGTFLHDLACEQRYQATEHGLETRRALKKLEKEGVLSECDDVVYGVRRYLEQKRKLSRSEARVLLRLQQEHKENKSASESSPPKRTADLDDTAFLDDSKEVTSVDKESIVAAEKLLRNVNTRYR